MLYVASDQCCIANHMYVKNENPWPIETDDLRKHLEKKNKNCSIMMCFRVFCEFWDRSDQGLSGKLFQFKN